jgi:hypothetical protein
MPATIISNITSFDYEPDIITDNTRDGISSFQFSIVGSFSDLTSNFNLDQGVGGVPDQPPGNFLVVRRNLTHIAGDVADGLYRLQVTAEGGTGNDSLYILETSYQYQKEIVSGFVQTTAIDIPYNYSLEWLSPTVTITTNSASEDVTAVQERVIAFASALEVQIIRNKPETVAPVGIVQFPLFGLGIDVNKVIVSGSSIEKAGGLFRVRASATKGQLEQIL